MRNGFRFFLMSALGVAACAWTAQAGDGKRVTFDTEDGVTLEGTFFAASPVAPAQAKDATVLLLHNIDKKTGGSSHQDGWDDLAKNLTDQGYSVLSFDFRGFGNSHAVSKDFWTVKNKHNLDYIKGANRNPPPDSIDHKDFDANSGDYYPYLVNDIVAAKSYLDRQTDKGQANSSNLILIGAGEGATLGAMYVASQWRLKKLNGIDPKTGMLTLDDPEGRDVAGAVWLSISPKLGGREVPTPLHNWMVEMGAENKVPMAFLYGANDQSADSLAKEALRAIRNRVKKDNPTLSDEAVKDRLEFTDTKGVEDSKLVGSQLLGAGNTQEWIMKYTSKVIDKRGPREARKHDLKKEDVFYWTFPGMRPVEAKSVLDDNIRIVPAQTFIRASAGG